jgi:hypothetical protein
VLPVDFWVLLFVVVVDTWLLGVILGVVCCCCVAVVCDASRFHFLFSVPSSAYKRRDFWIIFLKLHFLWRQPSVVSVGERKQECNVFNIPHAGKKPLPTYELIAVHTRKTCY